jgi:dimethylhistidine N-methyltransferase
LGSGSGKKTRWILEALSHQQRTVYSPIEISSAALAQCERELGHMDHVTILGLEREYLEGLSSVAAQRTGGEHLLVLFLGSTIGNFDRDAGMEFLKAVRRSIEPGDSLLLSTDLVKPEEQLILAYCDPLGVTAAFNMNILSHINRDLDADFDLSSFRHEARWHSEERRVEMHLRSLQDQRVVFRKANFEIDIREGETLWTESSHKFTAEEVAHIAGAAGYRSEVQWIDREWPFALSLFMAT